MHSESIEDRCYWFTHRDSAPAHSALVGDHETDIAIIGGGFTGLWSAYFIKKLKPEARVSLFEQERIGYGASGRNGGEPCSTLDQSHLSAIEHFGLEEAKRMARFAEENYRAFGEFAADCDFENTGWLHPALVPEHMDAYAKSKEGAEQVGAKGWTLLTKEEVQARLNSPLYIGGAFSPEGGIVNPMKILMKLKREAEAAGVEIFEHTKITKVRGNTLTAAGGTVRAKRTILATDAFGHRLFPQLLHKFVPLYDYVVVSEPLSEEQLSRVGWKGREAVADARTFFNYYRLTADNRILWGSSEAHYYSPNDVDPSHDYSESHRKTLMESFARHFPQLSDVRFEYAWGGPIAATTRLSPCFGRLERGKVLYGLGYTGQGVVCSRFAGQVLAHMALDLPSELLSLSMVRRSPLPYPPEPLRRWAIAMVTKALRKTDAGGKPGLLLWILEKFNIEFSS